VQQLRTAREQSPAREEEDGVELQVPKLYHQGGIAAQAAAFQSLGHCPKAEQTPAIPRSNDYPDRGQHYLPAMPSTDPRKFKWESSFF